MTLKIRPSQQQRKSNQNQVLPGMNDESIFELEMADNKMRSRMHRKLFDSNKNS